MYDSAHVGLLTTASHRMHPMSPLTVYAIALVYGLGRAVAARPTLPGEMLLAVLGVLLFLLLCQHDLRR